MYEIRNKVTVSIWYLFLYLGVDGGWSEEGVPIYCSASCGGGFGVTMRFCNNPTPIPPGKGCQGYSEVTGPCNMHPC